MLVLLLFTELFFWYQMGVLEIRDLGFLVHAPVQLVWLAVWCPFVLVSSLLQAQTFQEFHKCPSRMLRCSWSPRTPQHPVRSGISLDVNKPPRLKVLVHLHLATLQRLVPITPLVWYLQVVEMGFCLVKSDEPMHKMLYWRRKCWQDTPVAQIATRFDWKITHPSFQLLVQFPTLTSYFAVISWAHFSVSLRVLLLSFLCIKLVPSLPRRVLLIMKHRRIFFNNWKDQTWHYNELKPPKNFLLPQKS